MVFTLLACGRSEGEPVVAPEVTFDAPRSTDGTPAENLVLPLTSLMRSTHTDEVLVQTAANVLTARCMADRGFDFPLTPASEMARDVIDQPFGPWDEAAIADGYGQPVGESWTSTLEQFMASLPPGQGEAWSAAYMGSQDLGHGRHIAVTLPDGSEVESDVTENLRDGCYFTAFEELYGDFAYRAELGRRIEELVNDAAVEAEDHSQVVDQALDVWQQCMEAEGIEVDDGGDGPEGIQSTYLAEPGVSDEERTVARVDVACKARANLHDAYYAARADAERQAIEDNRVVVDAWRELNDATLARAREIVADGG